jgi:hypothetical protein
MDGFKAIDAFNLFYLLERLWAFLKSGKKQKRGNQRAWRDSGCLPPVEKIGRLPFFVLSIFRAMKSILLKL